MFRQILFATAAMAVLLCAPVAQALEDGTYNLRRQADSEFRIAQKAYRNAKAAYGDSLESMPADERESACRKIGWALHDNRTRYTAEDMISQMQYKRQVQALEGYASEFGCPN
jgi:hypothetical protein